MFQSKTTPEMLEQIFSKCKQNYIPRTALFGSIHSWSNTQLIWGYYSNLL